MIPSEVAFNSNTIQGLTPATNSGSAWGNAIGALGSFVKDLAPTVAGVYTSAQANKYSEKIAEAQAAANRSTVVNPALANQQQPSALPTDYTKLIVAGVVVLGVVAGAVYLIKRSK